MIKSDKWIKSKCLVPTFVATRLEDKTPFSLTLSAPRTYEEVHYYTHKTSEQLELEIAYGKSDDKGQVMTKLGRLPIRYRELTAEEKTAFKPMISPFEPNQVRRRETWTLYGDRGEVVADVSGDPIIEKVISYGVSSFGYDVQLADEFELFTNVNSAFIDPKNFDKKCLVKMKGNSILIPPNSYILGRTVETFDIPRNVTVVCVGKSTYARCGAIVNVTPIEAGFQGQVVIEISNSASLPLKIYAYEGIAQLLFFESDEECEVSYADRQGKYQNQTGITLAKV